VKIYKRDKRSPKPKNESTSKVMSANKHKNTKPEIMLRRALYAKGLRGYRIHSKQLPGKPDIAFISKKIAVFINGCFWHRCPHCNYSLPKNNTQFWKEKFEKNIQRDEKKKDNLESIGWQVVTVWECELKKNIETQIRKIKSTYDKSC
jgi:DNA mismatch endonuclease (patch repair protein)